MKNLIIISMVSLFSLSIFGQTMIWQSLNEPGNGGAVTSIRVSPYNANRILIGGDMLGITYTLNGGQTWLPSFGLNSWEIADFTWHPTDSNIVWAVSMSGPFKSTDGGVNWTMMRTGFDPVLAFSYSCPVQKIIYDPNDATHLLAFGGSWRFQVSPGAPKWNSLWESIDGGNNWTEKTVVGSVLDPGIMNATYVGSSKIAAAVYGQGIYLSSDNGVTWTASNTGLTNNNVTWITVDPTDTTILYTCTNNYLSGGTFLPGGVFKSIDGGATWTNSSNGLGQNSSTDTKMASYYRMVKVSPTNSNVLYTADGGWLGADTYKSVDGGATWNSLFTVAPANTTSVFYPTSGPELYVFDFDNNNGNVLIGGNWEYVLKTTDGGVNWNDVMSEPTSTPGYFTGNGYSGIVATNFEFNPYNANEAAFQGYDDGKFVISKDNLNSWKRGGVGMTVMNGGQALSYAGTNGTTIYCATGQLGMFDGIWKSIDGGDNWVLSDYTAFAGCTQLGGEPHDVYALPNTPNTAWVSVQFKLYQTINGGTSWTQAFAASGITTIAPAKNSPNTFYLNSADGVYKTTDGTNFTLMTGSPMNGRRIHVDPNDDNVLYITKFETGDGEEGLWKYDGTSWSMLRSDSQLFEVAVQPGNSQVIVAVTEDYPYHDVMNSSGVWLSIDGGSTWTQQNNGLPMTRHACVTFNPHQPNQVVVGLEGRGFYKTDISPLLGINSYENNSFLDINLYPNPAKSDVTVSFTLEKESKVEIKFFDINGKQLKTLLKQKMTQGEQNVKFDRDRLATGIYYLQISIEGFISVKKLVIE